MQLSDCPQPLRDDGESAALAQCYRLLLRLTRRKMDDVETTPIATTAEVKNCEEIQQTKDDAGRNVLADVTSAVPNQSATNPCEEVNQI